MSDHLGSILITGCSTGIGYTTAQQLKQLGYRVFASARAEQDVLRLKQEGFETVRLDLSDSVSIQQAVESVLKATGGTLDALFNNGAFGQPGAVEDLSRTVLKEQFECNLFGTHELTNLVIPVMRKQGHGKILYNSSVLGFVAMRFRGAYNASKFALEGLADTLRLELAGSGIDIVLIEPGPILSEFRNNSFKLYKKNINAQNSVFKDSYRAIEARLQKEGPAVPFTLPSDAVSAKVIKALKAKRPRTRYYVTFPTYLFGYLKRILPDRLMDRILRSV